jgi:XTP/dITP diphosphohydrolase
VRLRFAGALKDAAILANVQENTKFMDKLLIATHNPGKRRELAEIFQDIPFELLTLDDVGIQDDVEETGKTFEENALLKADAYSKQTGLLTLADDSGIEVDALGGEPGVYSKRYAGEDKTDEERNVYLLEKLRKVPPDKRTARFRCAIIIADNEGHTWLSEGKIEGSIAYAPRGTNGFGYDPIFIIAGREQHLSEVPAAEKNQISHRGLAAKGARPILLELAHRKHTGAT